MASGDHLSIWSSFFDGFSVGLMVVFDDSLSFIPEIVA